MEKAMGILLMVTLGITGTGAAALAWICPSLQLDKAEASLAGIIGMGFVLFQGLRFRHYSHAGAETAHAKITNEEKP